MNNSANGIWISIMREVMEFSEIFLLLILVREVRASVGEAHVCEASQMIGSVNPEDWRHNLSETDFRLNFVFLDDKWHRKIRNISTTYLLQNSPGKTMNDQKGELEIKKS